MEREDLTNKVIDCAYRVLNKLGFGFESGYVFWAALPERSDKSSCKSFQISFCCGAKFVELHPRVGITHTKQRGTERFLSDHALIRLAKV